MTDLYAAGWRQGSVFELDIHIVWWTLDDGLRPSQKQFPHSQWVVCSQDCDLERADADSHEPVVEIRPVYNAVPPSDWGIRSRKLRLSKTQYVDCDSPRAAVSPVLLSSCSVPEEPDLNRALAFKTWLGRRYDRPAVPPEFVELARTIAARCSDRKATIRNAVHDVLMRFDSSTEPIRVGVFAVVTDDAVKAEAREWLAASVVGLPDAVVEEIDVGTRHEVSLAFVEESYSADLSQVTWKGETPSGA